MSLRSKILLAFLAVITSALIFTLLLVQRSVQAEGSQRSIDALSVGQKVFNDKLQSQLDNLLRAARIIGKDDALRQAVFDDEQSLHSSLKNFLERLKLDNKANLMWLLELDGEIISSAGVAHKKAYFAFPEILEYAEQNQWSSTFIAPINNSLYELAVVGFFVPVQAPSPSFWIVVGNKLGARAIKEFSALTNLDVYISSEAGSPLWVKSKPLSLDELTQSNFQQAADNQVVTLNLKGEPHYSLKIPLPSADQHKIVALLAKSQTEIKRQINALNTQLLVIGVIALIGSLVAAAILAKNVTRPLLNLVNIAQNIGRGHYSASMNGLGSGEVATLADALSTMQQRICAREKEIQHIAFHDQLTELPNRTAFALEIDRCIEQSRHNKSTFIICVLDFDRFKDINDTLGHHSGDKVLTEFAHRLRAWSERDQPSASHQDKNIKNNSSHEILAREKDNQTINSPGGSLSTNKAPEYNTQSPLKIARLGGDEFGFLIPQCLVLEDTLDNIRLILSQPIDVDRVVLDIRASMGVSLYPEHGETSNTLMQTAEVAMYLAKKDVRDVVYYEKSRDHHSMQRLTLMAELRNAIEIEQLRLYYQPKLDLTSNTYRYVECLVRWVHPKFGFISPDDFIGYAEQTGAIRDLTRWVIITAIKQCKQWQAQGFDLRIAVNISALDLVQAEFSSWVIHTLKEFNLAPKYIMLEVTESAVMRDIDLALASLHALNNHGVGLSIDDYGTGYSSMAQLKCLPVKELKIDKSFVLNLADNNDDLVIVKSTIELGHNMDLKIVAEGVENSESLEVLRALQCDYAQGFYLSKPMSSDATQQWINDNKNICPLL